MRGYMTAVCANFAHTAADGKTYPSVEAKAAHLLYFVIKNHPFAELSHLILEGLLEA